MSRGQKSNLRCRLRNNKGKIIVVCLLGVLLIEVLVLPNKTERLVPALLEAKTDTGPTHDVVGSKENGRAGKLETPEASSVVSLPPSDQEKPTTNSPTNYIDRTSIAATNSPRNNKPVSQKNSATNVALNLQSTLADGIFSIHHVPKDRQVIVTFQRGATCPHPYLRGRLSGPALIMLENWTHNTLDDGLTTMTGIYQTPDIADEEYYYLEIIAVFCTDFFTDLEKILQTETGSISRSDLNFDFTAICVEDPWRHRITEKGAYIRVLKRDGDALAISGVWRKRPELKKAEDKPLYTRYQTFACFNNTILSSQESESDMPSECQDSASLERFSQYSFEWSSPLQKLMQTQSLKQPDDSAVVVCLIGASHSRKLYEAAQRIQLQENMNIRVEFAEEKYPRNLDAVRIGTFLSRNGCHKAIVAMGQWPASYTFGEPTLLGDYYKQMKRVFQTLQRAAPQVQVFARSIHYNPLAGRISRCPPMDWRSPLVIDAYNAVIQRLCREIEIPYIETNFLVGPVWDAAPDWSHLSEESSDIEILYLVAVALGLVTT